MLHIAEETAPGVGAVDPAVVERARQGDRDAFAAIYTHYHPSIQRHAYRLLGNREQADDLAQETFVRAYQHRAGLRPDPYLRAWLYRIASNACLDVLRRRRHVAWQPLADAPAADAALTTADFAPRVAEREALRAALAQLRPALRIPLLLHLAGGWSCQEIADHLRVSRGSIHIRLYRARVQLAQVYGAA